MAAVNALCLLVLFALASVQYDALFSGLVRDRVAVVAQVLAEPFQAVTELGLSVDTLRDVDALLLRTKQSSADILDVYLFDQAGNIVRSTAPDLVDAAALAAKDALANSDGGTWFGNSKEGLLVASFVNGPDGKVAGGVLLAHGDGGRSLHVAALVGKLAFAASGVLAISLALGLGILRFTLRGHIQVFDALLTTYDRFERQAWRGIRTDEVPPTPVRGFGIDTDELFTLLSESEEKYQAVNPSRLSVHGGGPKLET